MNIDVSAHGNIISMGVTGMSDWHQVAFRDDDHAGPSWQCNGHTVAMQQPDTKHLAYEGNHDGLDFRLDYNPQPEQLTIRATICNPGTSERTGIKAGIQLGIDSYMDQYPQWNDKLFPTLLRCEKTHFWGYFMGPKGQILLITVPEPVASYHLHYKPKRHRIYTATLDLMHPPPLPRRHPQHQDKLQPGESKTWTVNLTPLPALTDVKPTASAQLDAPMIDADLYTISKGDSFEGRITTGTSPLQALSLDGPDGKTSHVRCIEDGDRAQRFAYGPCSAPGIYTLRATSCNGQTSEAKLALRHPWSWYLLKARENAVRQEQKASSHTESWYGLFSAYLARQYAPDDKLDAATDKRFDEIWPLMYDMQTKQPLSDEHRIQNHACAAGLMADKFAASGDLQDLQFAAALADFIVASQGEDGGYYAGGRTHYTCVIYIAKSLMEVVKEEYRVGTTDPVWQERADRHLASVKQAIDDLLRRGDDIETEGEMTYEDGMIACSYTQLAMYALTHASPQDRQAYIDASLQLLNGHRALSQLLIPDCRMNGGSLRFWEAQYDVLTFPNMMSSPHGWSAWRLYGLWYLYQLTGDEDLLRQVYNGLGACCQLIDTESGDLRWAFVTDPFIEADVWEEDPSRTGHGHAVDRIIGEQYLPMISHWYKAPPGTKMFAYGRHQDGGCCDNDVHEIFKCLEEVTLTSAYLVERSGGQVIGYNCSTVLEDGTIVVAPAESLVNALHVNLHHPRNIEIPFADQHPTRVSLSPGLHWIRSSD